MRYIAQFLVFFFASLSISQLSFAETVTREATFYSDSFDGGSTSSGDRFSQNVYSAAVCGIDLGQYIYVSR